LARIVTTHYGWLAPLARVGRTEMAAIWATGELWLRVPEGMKVIVTGRLGRGITVKDLSAPSGMLGADGGLYQSINFGPAIKRCPARRMVIQHDGRVRRKE
jgi:homoaconitase/3-isopropylmalate dehydratase large subunit